MRKLTLHPVLFALFPVVYVFSTNVRQLTPGELVLPVAVALAVGCVGLAMASAFSEDLRRPGIALSGLFLLVGSYGHLWKVLRGVEVGGFNPANDALLIPLWVGLGTALVFGVRRAKALDELTLTLNSVAVLLVAIWTIPAVLFLTQRPDLEQFTADAQGSGATPAAGAVPDRDIYYVILDRYAGPATLEEEFRISNEGFFGALKEQGFYVARESLGNYQNTTLSLASSLNMDYLDVLTRVAGEETGDLAPAYQMLRDFEVARFLGARGYQYAHIGSWWDQTAESPIADVNYTVHQRSDFQEALYEGSLMWAIGKRFEGDHGVLDGRRARYEIALSQFDAVRRASHLPGRTFVFAHILLPHPPFVFHEDGTYKSEAEEEEFTWQENYLHHLEFTNEMVVDLLGDLLDAPADQQPIILLQSDEGPHPQLADDERQAFEWGQATTDQLRLKLRILNAYHLPGLKDPPLYPSISPVNSFRLVFDGYFDTDFGLLPDESYVSVDKHHAYRFINVTGRVRGGDRSEK